jgi:hypothetical protein
MNARAKEPDLRFRACAPSYCSCLQARGHRNTPSHGKGIRFPVNIDEKRVAATVWAIHLGGEDIIARIRNVKSIDPFATLCRDKRLD